MPPLCRGVRDQFGLAVVVESFEELRARRQLENASRLAKQNGHENQCRGKDKHPSQLGALTARGVLLETADVCPGPGGGDHRLSSRRSLAKNARRRLLPIAILLHLLARRRLRKRLHSAAWLAQENRRLACRGKPLHTIPLN